jgi:hypothetical protein
MHTTAHGRRKENAGHIHEHLLQVTLELTGARAVEGGGGVEGGDAEVGQPDGTKKFFTVIRVSRRRGYSPYTQYIIGIG